MIRNTGIQWLDGTRANPEAVLNATQTKAFLSFTDDLAALRASGAITNNSNVIIDTISFNVESMSSPEDGEKPLMLLLIDLNKLAQNKVLV